MVLESLCFIGVVIIATKDRWARWLCLIWISAAVLDRLVG
jgi:hypothetical protein